MICIQDSGNILNSKEGISSGKANVVDVSGILPHTLQLYAPTLGNMLASD